MTTAPCSDLLHMDDAARLRIGGAWTLANYSHLQQQIDALQRPLAANQTVDLQALTALDTAGAQVVVVEPNWRTRLLGVIADPSVALILMMIGIYGLLFEFSSPGFGLPGVLGGICLLIALYAFQLLPINYAGLGLIALGVALMVVEAFIPSFGVLGIGGIVAFVVGAVILIDADIPGYGVPLGLIVPISILSAVAIFFIVTMALKARRRPVVSGAEELVGSVGEVMEDFTGEGWARVHSENWRISSPAPLKRGQKVRVTRVRGLILEVEPKPEGGKS